MADCVRCRSGRHLSYSRGNSHQLGGSQLVRRVRCTAWSLPGGFERVVVKSREDEAIRTLTPRNIPRQGMKCLPVLARSKPKSLNRRLGCARDPNFGPGTRPGNRPHPPARPSRDDDPRRGPDQPLAALARDRTPAEHDDGARRRVAPGGADRRGAGPQRRRRIGQRAPGDAAVAAPAGRPRCRLRLRSPPHPRGGRDERGPDPR